MPLEANVKINYYKLIFLDIGLVHAISGVASSTISENDFTSVYKGAIAEQFVGQELLAYANLTARPSLYYWARDARGSSAEVDYIANMNNKIVPIEVKSGAKGRAKSLIMFIEKYNSEIAYKISQAKYCADDLIIDIPLYALSHLALS